MVMTVRTDSLQDPTFDTGRALVVVVPVVLFSVWMPAGIVAMFVVIVTVFIVMATAVISLHYSRIVALD
jgi:hypothetical protein